MNYSIPLINLPLYSACDSSPTSEELREGIETKHYPFIFPSNDTIARIQTTLTNPSKINAGEISPRMRVVQNQFRQIEVLTTGNLSLQNKADSLEKELRRIKTVMREKDRRIKELEGSLEMVTDELKLIHHAKTSQHAQEKLKAISSTEYYMVNPPRRTWNHPALDFAKNIQKLKEKITSLI